MLTNKLKEMFAKMVVLKDASLIPVYYHVDFICNVNEKVISYSEFLTTHEAYYATNIQYQVEYDDATFIEQGEKIAGRMWITTKRPNEAPTKLEVVLIAQYKEDKLFRIWELTYPD